MPPFALPRSLSGYRVGQSGYILRELVAGALFRDLPVFTPLPIEGLVFTHALIDGPFDHGVVERTRLTYGRMNTGVSKQSLNLLGWDEGESMRLLLVNDRARPAKVKGRTTLWPPAPSLLRPGLLSGP